LHGIPLHSPHKQHPKELHVHHWGDQGKNFQLGQQNVGGAPLGTISTNHSSPKARTISLVQIRSGQAVKLQPGCFIRTMDYINMADEAEQVT